MCGILRMLISMWNLAEALEKLHGILKQIRSIKGGFQKGGFQKGGFQKGGGLKKRELVVVLDSGKRVPLLRILPKVIEMWEELLSEMDPLPESVSEL